MQTLKDSDSLKEFTVCRFSQVVSSLNEQPPAGWSPARYLMSAWWNLSCQRPEAGLYAAIRSAMCVSDNVPFLFTNGALHNRLKRNETQNVHTLR